MGTIAGLLMALFQVKGIILHSITVNSLLFVYLRIHVRWLSARAS